MKLYELQKGAKINCEVSDGSKFIIFDHPDGMFSYCTTEKGGIVHPAAVSDVEKDGRDYKFTKGV